MPTDNESIFMFSPGEIVSLKSGGPRMTVEGISGEPGLQIVDCSWFLENGECQEGEFSGSALMPMGDTALWLFDGGKWEIRGSKP